MVISSLANSREACPLHMSDDDLCYLSASEALALFRKRSLKPSELLAALHKRAAKVNPAINCFADV